MRWLVFGSNGWIGQKVCLLLQQHGETVISTNVRCDDEIHVENEIINIKPDRIVSLIGRTHGPNYSTIDYLELPGKLLDNIRDNLYSPMVLAILSKKYGIHLTYLGTGCIFDGYKDDNGYDEEDRPDFFGSSYSTVKGFTDRLMHFFDDSVLNLRLRMPIDSSDSNRNFISKIMTYKKICSKNNSMSVLPELLPIMIDMAKNKVTGTFNFTNPGMISHNEILEMVKEIYDPNFKWENFSIEEQDKILLSKRSNNLLNATKLHNMYPQILPIKESIRNIIKEMAELKNG